MSGSERVVLIREITAADTLDLRARVLRDGRPHEGFPEDERAGTFHLGAVEDDVIVGVASFIRRDDGAWQLRGMAVDAGRQGAGIGLAILEHAVARLRGEGASLLWANGRDTALGFYERAGFTVVGDGYVMGESGLPHHRVELALTGQ